MPIRFDHQLPRFVAAITKLRARAASEGIEFTTADDGGYRDAADTARILGYRAAEYAAAVKRDPRVAAVPVTRWRPASPYGSSAHNWGGGRDLTPIKWPAGWTAARALRRLGELAPACGLRWGGLFNGGTPAKPYDPNHFELATTITAMRAEWVKLYGEPFTAAAPALAARAAAPLVIVAALLGAVLLARWSA